MRTGLSGSVVTIRGFGSATRHPVGASRVSSSSPAPRPSKLRAADGGTSTIRLVPLSTSRILTRKLPGHSPSFTIVMARTPSLSMKSAQRSHALSRSRTLAKLEANRRTRCTSRPEIVVLREDISGTATHNEICLWMTGRHHDGRSSRMRAQQRYFLPMARPARISEAVDCTVCQSPLLREIEVT